MSKSTRFILLVFTILIFNSLNAQHSDWVRNAGSNRQSSSLSIDTDESGNVYTMDFFLSTSSTVAVPYYNSVVNSFGISLSKFDPAGNLLWNKIVSTGNSESFSNGIYIDGLRERRKYSIVVLGNQLLLFIPTFGSQDNVNFQDGPSLTPQGGETLLVYMNLDGDFIGFEEFDYLVKRTKKSGDNLLMYGAAGTGVAYDGCFIEVRNILNETVYYTEFFSDFKCNSMEFFEGDIYIAGKGSFIDFNGSIYNNLGNAIIRISTFNNSVTNVEGSIGGSLIYIAEILIQNNKLLAFISNTGNSTVGGIGLTPSIRSYDLALNTFETAVLTISTSLRWFVDVKACSSGGFICLLSGSPITPGDCGGENLSIQLKRISESFSTIWSRNYSSVFGGSGYGPWTSAINGAFISYSNYDDSYYLSGRIGGAFNFLDGIGAYAWIEPGVGSASCSLGNITYNAKPFEAFVLKLQDSDPALIDFDNDGETPADGDCNDFDATVNTTVLETCDGLDNNCNTIVDEGFDLDNDGFMSCSGDCDDGDATVFPGALDIEDDLDNNCNDLIDENSDSDGDGFTPADGDCDDLNIDIGPNQIEICNGLDDNCNDSVDEGFDSDNDGFTFCGGDCDDNDASINPNATDFADGIDNDCDESIDEDVDADGDGVTIADGDCDDSNPAIGPNQLEFCNGIDDNCNDIIDENFDADADGFTLCNGDCNDSNNLIFPGALEQNDGLDNDCDGEIDESFDNDGDDITEEEGDCDDSDPSISPNMPELCNQLDDNCNDQIDEGLDCAISDADLFIPTGFSPNSDGYNDTWQIPWLAEQSGYSVKVVNRWEQSVFYTTNYSIGWDGTHSGEKLPASDYYYVISLSNGVVLTGALTIKY